MLWKSLFYVFSVVTVTSAEPIPEGPQSSKLPAPAGCKKLPSDADWPSNEVLNAELKGWEPRVANQSLKHPDWIYEVKTVANVQRAVKFAAKHNVRISILNSGHDFLGR
jgi:hypothetical protein